MKISKDQQLCDRFLISKTSPNRTIFSVILALCVISLLSFTVSYYVKYKTIRNARRKTILRLPKTTKDYRVVSFSRRH